MSKPFRVKPWADTQRVMSHFPFSALDMVVRCTDGGLSELVRDIYTPPSNATEALAHKQFLDAGYSVLRKGWPDLLVFSDKDLFCVEVKQGSDTVSAAQRAVLEILASCGIDTYVAQKWGENGFYFEEIGDSTLWADRGMADAA